MESSCLLRAFFVFLVETPGVVGKRSWFPCTASLQGPDTLHITQSDLRSF